MKDTEKPAALPEEHPYAYKQEDGILIYYKKFILQKTARIWVPREVRTYIIKLFHDTPSARHMGIKKMLGMMEEVICGEVCQLMLMNSVRDVRSASSTKPAIREY